METTKLYFLTILLAFVLSAILTPLVRWIAIKKKVMDEPATAIKTHKIPTPLSGGLAFTLAFLIALLVVRHLTHFPTGTLTKLRAIMIGGVIMAALGFIDDLKKPVGLSVRTKFIFQFLSAGLLVFYGIQLNFLSPNYLSVVLSLLWVVGLANALNIIDIMDGFSSSQAAIAAMGFLLIALPSEDLYVNFAAAALVGSVAGFIPYNLSKRCKIFMGDSGSLFLGFVLAALAMGTRYDKASPLGVYAPLFILAIPIYDTFFVSVLRMLRGESPFMGSKDHYALRLERMGFTRHQIVSLSAIAAAVLSFCALVVTKLPLWWALWVYIFVGGEFLLLSVIIAKVNMRDDHKH
ncbi:MAG: MraY family glycosyltransferase [Elusimicrobiaceae bacterium]